MKFFSMNKIKWIFDAFLINVYFFILFLFASLSFQLIMSNLFSSFLIFIFLIRVLQAEDNSTSLHDSTSDSPFSLLLQPHQCPRIPLGCSTRETVEEHRLLTRQLFHRLNLWKIGAASRPTLSEHSPNTSFALLEMGKDIVKAGCPSHFVSPRTLDMALSVFILLHGMNKERYEEPIGGSTFDRMAPILAACENSFHHGNKDYFQMDTEDMEAVNCFESGSPTPIHQTCRNLGPDLSSCTPLLPRTNRFCPENNLILEIVWNIVDFVFASCLPHFRAAGATSAFHLWEQTQERLFTRRITKYWYESRLTSHEYQTILGQNVLMDAYNLEMCVEGMYSTRSSFAYRLNRPSYQFRIYRRKRRSINFNGGIASCP